MFISAGFVTVQGIVFGVDAVEPSSSLTDQIADGSASAVLLGVAATTFYALIQGKIVPLHAFESRLTVMEHDLTKIHAAIAANSVDTAVVRERTDTAHKELKEMLAALTQQFSEWRHEHEGPHDRHNRER